MTTVIDKSDLYENKRKFVFFLSIFILTCFLLFSNYQYANAITTVKWDFATGHSTNDGGVNAFATPVIFTVGDTNLSGNGKIDKIQVRVNSTSDQVGIELTLTENPSDNGVFKNTNLIFTNGPSAFHQNDKVTVGLNDSNGDLNPNKIDYDPDPSGPLAFGILVFSSTDPAGIPLFLKESGPHTGRFFNPLEIASTPSVANSTIQANPGDIVSIFNQDSGQMQNWLILPNSDPALGAIPANEGDNVSAIYNGVKDKTWLNAASGGGGGGGGLIRPSLVLDFLAGSGGFVAPPSFGGNYLHYSDGLTFTQGKDTTKFDTSKYNQELPRQVMVKGTPVNMTFKTFEGYNPEKGLIGMTLYIIPRGPDLNMDASNSIASIEWKRGTPVEVDDPNHILSKANASSSTDGKFQYTQFSFTPAKSYDKMSFLARAWNDHLGTTEVRVHDDLNTPPPPKTLPVGVVKYDIFNDLQAELEKEGFYKPTLMSHIHDTNAVFTGSDGGSVYWLYDTLKHSVTLVISDNNDNNLYSYQVELQPYAAEKKGDYKFMNFTSEQLNRWDETQEQKAMDLEAEKAMALAQEKGIMPQRNWQFYLPQ